MAVINGGYARFVLSLFSHENKSNNGDVVVPGTLETLHFLTKISWFSAFSNCIWSGTRVQAYGVGTLSQLLCAARAWQGSSTSTAGVVECTSGRSARKVYVSCLYGKCITNVFFYY